MKYVLLILFSCVFFGHAQQQRDSLQSTIDLKEVTVSSLQAHTKPTKETKGGIVSKESFIHQSNVKNIDSLKETKKVANKK